MILGWKGDDVNEDHAGVDGWSGVSFESKGVDLGAGKSARQSGMERADKWSVKWWLSEWHGTGVQTQDCEVLLLHIRFT